MSDIENTRSYDSFANTEHEISYWQDISLASMLTGFLEFSDEDTGTPNSDQKFEMSINHENLDL
jgi:hypothetical protein